MIAKMYLYLILLRVIPTVMSQKMSDAVKQDLITPVRALGDGCGYESCPYVEEGVLNVHIVPHSHGELGLTRTFYQHYSGQDDYYPKSNINWKRILDFVITELWEHRDRKFTLSDIPYLFHWWSHRDGTVHRMVYQLIRQGRLHIVGGGWGMPDESCPSYHAIIDHFTHSLRKLNYTFGPCGRPLVAWQADVLGHSREFTNLASMLAFDGLFINPISFEDEVNRMKNKELEMLWRGSDDLGPESDIFTHKLFDGYWSPPGFCFGSMCNDSLIITTDHVFKNVEERVSAFIDSAKNRQGFHYATNHIMVMMGTRDAYFDATMWFNNIDSLIENVNIKSSKSGDKVRLMYSAPACYLKAIYDSSPTLPIKQDDFMPITFDKSTHFTGLFTSRPTIKFMAREGHVFLQMAKQLHVLAGLPANVTKLYDELTWVMGVFQDHNIITGAMRAHVKDFYTLKMFHAVQKSTLVMIEAFNKLRSSPASTLYYRCAFNISSCRNTNALRSFIVIYNPLAWPVTMPVRLPVIRHKRHKVFNPKLQTVKAVSMKMSAAVLNIPQRQTVADHEIVFMAENLPPMGYRSYYIESVTVAKQKRKRSIIKKMPKNQKKYLSRQTDQMKIDDESMLDTVDEAYEDDIYGSTVPPNYANDLSDADESNKPLFNVPEAPKRSMPEYADVDEEEEKKHRGLFGKVKPTNPTKLEEDYSWILADDIPKHIAEEEGEFYRRHYDTSPTHITEREEDLRKHYDEYSKHTLKQTQSNPPKLTTAKVESKKHPTSNERVTEHLSQGGKNVKFFTPTEKAKHYRTHPRKPTIKEKPDQFESYRKSIEEEHHRMQNKYKLLRRNPFKAITLTKDTKKDFESYEHQQKTNGNTTKELVTGFAMTPPTGVKLYSDHLKQLYRTSSDLALTTEKENSLVTEKEDSKTLKRFTDDSDFETENPVKYYSDDENYPSMFMPSSVDRGSKSSKSPEIKPSTKHSGTTHIPAIENSGYHGPPKTIKKKLKVKVKENKEAPMAEDEEDRRLFDKPLSSRRMMGGKTTPRASTTTEYDPWEDPEFDEDRNYFYRASKDKFIKNKYVKVHLNEQNQVSRVTLSNGVEVALAINFYYYASDDPDKMGRPGDKKPGAYVFRPMDPVPVMIKDHVRTVVHKTYLVEEVQYSLSSWVGFVLRIYVERPLIELDWVVGPIPTEDVGKDVFIRYTTDLSTDGVFYTDSNGRQTIKRVRNTRPTFQPSLTNVPSNYYPVTSKIHIEDPRKNIRFSVFNDRAQGGTSLHDGQIDLMLHRRILTDDTGVQTFLNDTEFSQGIVVRGKHIIYLSKADYKPNKIFEKKLAKEIELAPQVFASGYNAYGDNSKEIWYGQNNEFSGVVKKLPAGVHVLTLQEWNDNSLLLRLENYLEKADTVKSGVKTVNIKKIFANFTINSVRETTLGGNIWMQDWMPMQWNVKETFVKNFNEFYFGNSSVEYSNKDFKEHVVADVEKGIITLTPQQIRTFIVTYELHR